MYFKHITLRNVGPIESINYDFLFDDGNPKPLIIVGTNGSGKSVLLSHLLNPLMAAQQFAFDNAEVEKGKVYKLRSPQYIRKGSTYSYAKVQFGSNFCCDEWLLSLSREKYLENFPKPGIDESFEDIPLHEWSVFKENYSSTPVEVSKQFSDNCVLYFPANRFEQPAWLNELSLNAVAEFAENTKIDKISNRRIIQQSPLASSKNWLLDIVLDRSNYEMKTARMTIPIKDTGLGQEFQVPVTIFQGYQGRSENIWQAILKLVQLMFRTEDNIRLGIGPRQNRTISVMKNEEPFVDNIFQLSTGQTSILNIGLSILRDFDMSNASFEKIEDVTGVVIIDEVDTHLHADLQCNLLPEIISMFPKVQFILTTHSPLFLLGMKNRFGEAGFDVFSVPTGRKIDVEEFEEFQSAFEFYKDSDIFRRKVESEVAGAQKPVIFVEGDYDIKYLKKAASLLNKELLLDKVVLCDGDGAGNLTKIWKSLDNRLSLVLPNVVGLIYDCDVEVVNNDRYMLKKRGIPLIPSKSISKGIENLIPEHRIIELKGSHPHFFDITPEFEKSVRGQPVTQPETCKINTSEKRNLCDWLCGCGTAEDFVQFESVFTIIEEIIGLIQSEDLSISVGKKPG